MTGVTERLLLNELASVEQRIDECLQEQELHSKALSEGARTLFTLAHEFHSHSKRTETAMDMPTMLSKLRSVQQSLDITGLTLDRCVARETALYKARANVSVKLQRYRERHGKPASTLLDDPIEEAEWFDDNEPTQKPRRRLTDAKQSPARRIKVELEDVDTVEAINRMDEMNREQAEAEMHRVAETAAAVPSTPRKKATSAAARLPPAKDDEGWISSKRPDDWLSTKRTADQCIVKKQAVDTEEQEKLKRMYGELNRLDDYERYCESHRDTRTREPYRRESTPPPSVLVPESQPF